MLLVVFYCWNFFELSFLEEQFLIWIHFGNWIVCLWETLWISSASFSSSFSYHVYSSLDFQYKFAIILSNEYQYGWQCSCVFAHTGTHRLAAVIELTAGDKVGDGRTALLQLRLKKQFSLYISSAAMHNAITSKSEKRGARSGRRTFPSSVTKSSENSLHISKN